MSGFEGAVWKREWDRRRVFRSCRAWFGVKFLLTGEQNSALKALRRIGEYDLLCIGKAVDFVKTGRKRSVLRDDVICPA